MTVILSLMYPSYRDQFAMLSEGIARERFEMEVREKAQEKVSCFAVLLLLSLKITITGIRNVKARFRPTLSLVYNHKYEAKWMKRAFGLI